MLLILQKNIQCSIKKKIASVVLVNIFTSTTVDCRCESRSGKTKHYEIGVCCFSAKNTTWVRAKTGWLGIMIMCTSGVTCLSADCNFSELAL